MYIPQEFWGRLGYSAQCTTHSDLNLQKRSYDLQAGGLSLEPPGLDGGCFLSTDWLRKALICKGEVHLLRTEATVSIS